MKPAVAQLYPRMNDVPARFGGRKALWAPLLALLIVPSGLRAADWSQWLGSQRDGIWRESGILEKFPPGGPALRWRTEIGAGYSGPSVAGNRVYVMDRLRADASGGGRASRAALPGSERVLCLDAATGEIVWKHEYDCPYDVAYPAGPRVTPLVADGRVYTLGTEGHLFCLDAKTGKVIWAREFKKDYHVQTPMWGFSANPLLDGNKLICMVRGPGSTVVAFDKHSGKELWRALSASEPGYCAPMIYEAGGRRQLIIWHPEALNSLNPESGGVYWSEPFNVRSGLTIGTPRKLGNRLFVSAFYNGSLMMELDETRPTARVLWRGSSNSERNTDGLHSLITTPYLEDGYIYGVCSYGQFRCLKADTGERVWETFEPVVKKSERWGTAFIVKHEDRFFLFNELGNLIIAKLSPAGYEEISRAHLLDPDNTDARRNVVWSHPAFAHRSIFARNDREMVCYSLAAPAASE
jgi:outer membrane protein assembly factor BamB